MAAAKRNADRLGGTSGPHRFLEPDDNRLGLALGGSRTPGIAWGGPLALADASVRTHGRRCAMPGCGKGLEDPIHLPPE